MQYTNLFYVLMTRVIIDEFFFSQNLLETPDHNWNLTLDRSAELQKAVLN